MSMSNHTERPWVRAGLALAALALLGGCASVAQVQVDETFPMPVASPRDISAALVFDENFRNFAALPNDRTRISFGPSQVDLLGKAFRGLFEEVYVVSSKSEVKPGTDLVITPSVREVQVSSPTSSYLNVYEVWIKYSLDIESGEGVPIDSWFLPAYGKTPDSLMLSRKQAIHDATIIALRDAGAKLLLDFYRIPAIHGWFEQQRANGEVP